MFGRYRSIIGSTYCTVINMIIPAVLIVFGFVITPLHTDYMIGIWGFSLACLIESGCEFFGFGPIYRKHNMGMEYLKTACGGADLIRRTVNTDSLCRVLRVTAYVMLPALIHADADNILRFIFAALVLAAVSVWSVNLTRHITIFSFMFLADIPIFVIGATMYAMSWLIPKATAFMMIAAVVILAAGLVFTDRYAKRKIEASYRD